MEQLNHFLDLWFGSSGAEVDPVERVERILRFNHRAGPGSFDGEVEILVVEQQGVWLWGRDPDGRYLERANEPGRPWRATGETAEEFWLHVAAVEAVFDLPATRNGRQLTSAVVDAIRRATRPLPGAAWTWPAGQRMHHRGASVVMICGDGDAHWVIASAPTEEALDWLDQLGATWDEHDSRHDLDA